MKSGAKANESGKIGENNVAKLLDSLSIKYMSQFKHYDVFYGSWNVYDFVCLDLDLTIENKNQIVGGSVDEKWAFNLLKFLLGKAPTKEFVMVFQGNEPRKNYYEFLRNLKDLVSTFTNEEAQKKMKHFHVLFGLDELEDFLKRRHNEGC